VPAPARVVLAHLRAGLRSLDVLLDPPGEVVDAEFEEQPAGESPSFTGAVVARAPIEVNLNDTITVRLTDRGREILAARIESEQRAIPEYLRGINPPANRRPDADGYLSTTIWDFANVFGCFLSMGAREPVAMTATLKPRGTEASAQPGPDLRPHLAAADKRARDIAQEVIRLHAELEAARRELEQTKAALQGAREGRDAAWDALVGLARRLDVAFDTTASPGELADLIFEASQRRREQREINDLAARLDEVRAALDLDADTYFGPVMHRLREVVGIAKAVRDAVGYVDFEGVADTAVADLHFAVKTGKQYDELAEALGCGLPADHANVRGKLEALKSEADSHAHLQRLRMALFLSMQASPAEIVNAVLSRIERLGELQDRAARNAIDALRILGCPEHVADVVGWAKLQAQQRPAGPGRPAQDGPKTTIKVTSSRYVDVDRLAPLKQYRDLPVSADNPRPVCIAGIATDVIGYSSDVDAGFIILARPVTAPAGTVVELIE